MSQVLAIAVVSGEEIQEQGLPVLKVYRTVDGGYILAEGMENIEKALIESLKNSARQNKEAIFFKVEVLPMSQRVRRANCL